MGHTLVTRLSPDTLDAIRGMMATCGGEGYLKIPFGRDCDRAEADKRLEYHVTLSHWARTEDGIYLPRLEDYAFPGKCFVGAGKPEVMPAEEGSALLYLPIEPSAAFDEALCGLQARLGCPGGSFLHLTLAVSRDHEGIVSLQRRLISLFSFPMTLTVEGLDLYHIWRPVEKVRIF